MNVSTNQVGTTLDVAVDGRLDTKTAPDLEAQLNDKLNGITDINLDFSNLAYISSAGLRVLLVLKKKMAANGGDLVVLNPNDPIKEVFEVTGFDTLLTIK